MLEKPVQYFRRRNEQWAPLFCGFYYLFSNVVVHLCDCVCPDSVWGEGPRTARSSASDARTLRLLHLQDELDVSTRLHMSRLDLCVGWVGHRVRRGRYMNLVQNCADMPRDSVWGQGWSMCWGQGEACVWGQAVPCAWSCRQIHTLGWVEACLGSPWTLELFTGWQGWFEPASVLFGLSSTWYVMLNRATWTIRHDYLSLIG